MVEICQTKCWSSFMDPKQQSGQQKQTYFSYISPGLLKDVRCNDATPKRMSFKTTYIINILLLYTHIKCIFLITCLPASYKRILLFELMIHSQCFVFKRSNGWHLWIHTWNCKQSSVFSWNKPREWTIRTHLSKALWNHPDPFFFKVQAS